VRNYGKAGVNLMKQRGTSRCLAALLAVGASAPNGAAPSPMQLSSSEGASRGSIVIKDITPKFLAFWRAATAEPLSADERFALWKKLDGFAAVPPTPEGDRIARKLLDAAWPKYPAAIPRIEKGAEGLEPAPQEALDRVASLLKPDRPFRLTLIVYVGAFEGNAFTMGQNGEPTVAVPVEESAAERGPVMTHEFVHATQIGMGTMAGGWVRTIGETALAEGLAMRVTQKLYPGLPATRFTEMPGEPGWLARADTMRGPIFRDIREVVTSSKSQDVFRYTMGTGPAGIDREAYYAGWSVVGYWLVHGMSYADIARIPESKAPGRVAAALDALIAQRR
jgi:hypothetical protein